jgi:hypothetical protein
MNETKLEMSQTEIAAFFEVDRATINQWHHRGLPYKQGGKGKANTYSGPLALRWFGARESAEKIGAQPKTPLDYIALSFALEINNHGETFDADRAMKMMDGYIPCTRDDVLSRVGYYQGVLDGRRRRR